MLGTFSLSAGYYDAYFKKAGSSPHVDQTRLRESFLLTMTLIIGPASPTVAFGIGENINDPITMYMSDILTIPVNLAGLPGMSFLLDYLKTCQLVLQIIGNYFDEKQCIKQHMLLNKQQNSKIKTSNLRREKTQ